MKRLLTLILAALVCLGTGLFFARRSPAPVPAISLLTPSQLPRHHVPLFARVIPATPRWAWAWRLREKVLGKPESVNLEAVVIGFAELSSTTWSNLALPKPAFARSDGSRVWLLDADDLGALRRRLKQTPGAEFLFPCRASTANGSAVGMFHGDNALMNGSNASVGLSLEFFPRLRGQVTDLTASIMFTEAVTNRASQISRSVSLQTNLSVAGRFQLTNGSGVFLFQPGARARNQRPLGLLLSASQPQPRK